MLDPQPLDPTYIDTEYARVTSAQGQLLPGAYKILRLDSGLGGGAVEPVKVRAARDAAVQYGLDLVEAGEPYAERGEQELDVVAAIIAADVTALALERMRLEDASAAARPAVEKRMELLGLPGAESEPLLTAWSSEAELRQKILFLLGVKCHAAAFLAQRPRQQQVFAARLGVTFAAPASESEAGEPVERNLTGTSPSPTPAPQGGGATTLPSPQGGGATNQEPSAPGTEQGSLAAETASAPQGSA